MVNFFVAIQSHISTYFITILGTRLSPTLTKAQAKQTWTDTRSNKPSSIMTIIIMKTAATTTNCLVNVFWRNNHCGNSIILPTILNCHLDVIWLLLCILSINLDYITNVDQYGPGFADVDNTGSNDNQQDYKRLVKTYVITPKSQCKKSAFISLTIPSCPHCQMPTVSQVLLCRNGAFAIIMTKHTLKF